MWTNMGVITNSYPMLIDPFDQYTNFMKLGMAIIPVGSRALTGGVFGGKSGLGTGIPEFAKFPTEYGPGMGNIFIYN